MVWMKTGMTHRCGTPWRRFKEPWGDLEVPDPQGAPTTLPRECQDSV